MALLLSLFAILAHNREEITGRVPTVLFVAGQLAKGEENVDA
jgi:hypothetical protein